MRALVRTSRDGFWISPRRTTTWGWPRINLISRPRCWQDRRAPRAWNPCARIPLFRGVRLPPGIAPRRFYSMPRGASAGFGVEFTSKTVSPPGSVAKIQSAFLTTMAVCADHGLSLEQKKEAPPSHSMLLLGDRADIRGHRVPVELATARRNEYRDTAQPPLLSWRMPPPQAAKMRAELTYAQSMCSAVLEVRRSTIARRVSAHRQAGRC